jgi:LysM repeat protein
MLKLRWTLILSLLLFLTVPAVAQTATHVVQPGENLFRIAQQYGVDVNALAQANAITNTWQIFAGQSLVIPGQISVAAPPDVAPASSGTPLYYTVQRGDQLTQIAQLYGLTADQLAQLNGIINPNLIYAGQQLIVGTETAALQPAIPGAQSIAALPTAQLLPMLDAAVALPAASAPQTTHVVQPGEGLASIALRYGVTMAAVAQANNIYNIDHILAGQTLIIPGAGSALEYQIISSVAAPAAPTSFGREIVVDLSDSRVYAYDNGVLIRNVLVSTGLPGTPTVQGDFTVQRKYTAQTMVGPGYYLPDVPYVLYFYEGYALHGTYWHNNFGQPMSHGCVNMPTPEAEWVFGWADVGTPVHVQY